LPEKLTNRLGRKSLLRDMHASLLAKCQVTRNRKDLSVAFIGLVPSKFYARI